MLRKYKIILLIIVLTAGGIISILGIWLFGSYNNREELFVSSAERALFNVVQEFYQQERANQNIKAIESARRGRFDGRFLSLIHKLYPEVDKNRVWSAWDSVLTERYLANDSLRRNQINEKRNDSGPIIPTFLLSRIDFSEDALREMSIMLTQEFERQGKNIAFDLVVFELPDNEFKELQKYSKQGLLITRPILINPDQKQYLTVEFDEPWRYILWEISGQLIISLILITTLLGSFVYLMRTISQQNKLAILRKSFVNNMTHELKTPISTVMAAIEAVQRTGSHNPHKASTYIELARKELGHLANMVERVLQIDVDENQKIALIKTEVDLKRLTQECIDSMEIITGKTRIIELKAKDEPLCIYADESHLRNVINNLLENAIKYSPQTIRVEVTLSEIGDEMLIEIRDQGKGILPEYQKKVFEVFFRVPEGVVHSVKGFGLGLAYVKQIVLAHNGKVWLESQIGKGSKFSIVIPKK